MAIAIRLPDMGTNVEECKILTWKVKQGDSVKRGEVLADIETDKAVAELESTGDGVLLQFCVPAGDTARTGDILAYLGQPGEPIEAAHREDNRALQPDRQPAEVFKAAGAPARRVSPIVRNLAGKLGVDLNQVKGTGAGGVITREDVQRAHQSAATVATPAPAAFESPSRVQAAVARAVQKSWREIPHLSVAASIDMTRAMELRASTPAGAAKISYDAIFLKALALAACQHPMFLARLEGERIVKTSGVHIALAVGLGNDLHLPVIHNLEVKPLATIQAEIVELVETMKRGALRSEHLGGGTMALSNLGMFPIDSFDAIIFPEHNSILTVGAVRNVPVVIDEEIAIRPLAAVRLAADHRLINGRTAAEFLTTLKKFLES